MPGYSGKSVVQKLGLKPGFRIFVDGAPRPYDRIIGDLPENVGIAARLKPPLDMVHVFATDPAALRKKLPACREAIAPDGMVWVSWPKKSSGVAASLSENQVRDTALALGLVDIKVCAVDETWSGLKLVIPVAQRKAKAPAKKAAPNKTAAKKTKAR
jgi:hypothetical protein